MEEGIYRMSLAEYMLVLIVIGLWLFAVISLARKLQQICNPPSVFPSYSSHSKTSLNPLTHHENEHSNDSIQSTILPPINFGRATSEPTIDASPRTTIDIRSPSETCLHTKSTMVQHMSSPSNLKLGKDTTNNSDSSLDFPHQSGYRIHVEPTLNKSILSQKLLYPKRLPSIIRRSLLDLHRRALYSNASPNIPTVQCVVKVTENNINRNHPVITTTITKIPFIKNKFQRASSVDVDDRYTDSQSNDRY